MSPSVPLLNLPRTPGGPRTTGWETLPQMFPSAQNTHSGVDAELHHS